MGEQSRSAQSSPQACPVCRPCLSTEETALSRPAAFGEAGWAIPHSVTKETKLPVFFFTRSLFRTRTCKACTLAAFFLIHPLHSTVA